MFLIFTLFLFLVHALCATNIPAHLVPEPNADRIRGIIDPPPGFFTPFATITLDTIDPLLVELQRMADGDSISAARFFDSLHSALFASTSARRCYQKGILPQSMGNCLYTPAGQTCTIPSALEFIEPVYRPKADMAQIVDLFRQRIAFLDLEKIVQLRADALGRVQLPPQQLLLRIIYALSLPSADDWSDLLGRMSMGLAKAADLIGYLMNVIEQRTDANDENVSFDADKGNAVVEAFDGLLGRFNESVIKQLGGKEEDGKKTVLDTHQTGPENESQSSLRNAVKEAGLVTFYQTSPRLAARIRNLLHTAGLPFSPALPEHDRSIPLVRLRTASPDRFLAFLAAKIAEQAHMYGLNIKLDLARISMDVKPAAIVGFLMDLTRLLYAWMAGLLEGDAAAWLAAHPTSSFSDYLEACLSEQVEDAASLVKQFFCDPRQRRILEMFAKDTISFLEGAIGSQVMEPAVRARLFNAIRDPSKLINEIKVRTGDLYADSFALVYQDPDQFTSVVWNLLFSSAPAEQHASGFDWFGWLRWLLLDPIKIAPLVVRLSGLGTREGDLVARLCTPVLGESVVNGYWIKKGMRDAVAKVKLPDWAAHFDPDKDYLEDAWSAIAPSQKNIDLVDKSDGAHIFYRLPSMQVLYDNILPRLMEWIQERAKDAPELSKDDPGLGLGALLWWPSTIGWMVGKGMAMKSTLSWLGIIGKSDKPTSGPMDELMAMVDDFQKSKIGIAYAAFYKSSGILLEEAGKWRLEKQKELAKYREDLRIAYESLLKAPIFHPNIPSRAIKYLIRGLLLFLTALLLSFAGILIFAPRGTRLKNVKEHFEGHVLGAVKLVKSPQVRRRVVTDTPQSSPEDADDGHLGEEDDGKDQKNES